MGSLRGGKRGLKGKVDGLPRLNFCPCFGALPTAVARLEIVAEADYLNRKV